MPKIRIIYPKKDTFLGGFAQGNLVFKDYVDILSTIENLMDKYKVNCHEEKDGVQKVKSNISATLEGVSGKDGLCNLYEFQAVFQFAKIKDSLAFIRLVMAFKAENTKNTGRFPCLLFLCALHLLDEQLKLPASIDTREQRQEILKLFEDKIERYMFHIGEMEPTKKESESEIVYDCNDSKKASSPSLQMQYMALIFNVHLNELSSHKENVKKLIKEYQKTCLEPDGSVRGNLWAKLEGKPGLTGYNRAGEVTKALDGVIDSIGFILLVEETSGTTLHKILLDSMLGLFPNFSLLGQTDEEKECMYQGILQASYLIIKLQPLSDKKENHLVSFIT